MNIPLETSRAPRFDTAHGKYHSRIDKITTLVVRRDELRQPTVTTGEGLITARYYRVKIQIKSTL